MLAGGNARKWASDWLLRQDSGTLQLLKGERQRPKTVDDPRAERGRLSFDGSADQYFLGESNASKALVIVTDSLEAHETTIHIHAGLKSLVASALVLGRSEVFVGAGSQTGHEEQRATFGLRMGDLIPSVPVKPRHVVAVGRFIQSPGFPVVPAESRGVLAQPRELAEADSGFSPFTFDETRCFLADTLQSGFCVVRVCEGY